LRADVAVLKADVAGLRGDVQHLDAKFDDLGRYMRVLHEDLIERIKAIQEQSGLAKAEFAEYREKTDARLDGVESAVRPHSRDIAEIRHSRH
jgi:hypothetical protein